MKKRQRNEVHHIYEPHTARANPVLFWFALMVICVQLFLPIAPVFADEGDTEQSSASNESSGGSFSEEDSAPASESDSNDGDVSHSDSQDEASNIEEADNPSPPTLPSDASETTPPQNSGETEEAGLEPSPQSELETAVSETTEAAPDATEKVAVPAAESDETVLPTDETEETSDAAELDDPLEETPPALPAETPTPVPSATSSPVILPPPEEAVSSTTQEVAVLAPEPVATPEEVVGEASTTPLESVAPEEVTVATGTPSLVSEVHMVTNDENRFTFGVNDCAQVANGSFYCKKQAPDALPLTEDRIFAKADAEGDSEIYIEKNGELMQITNNSADDAAPFYDSQSGTLVWHRLVDARYQIVSYDLKTGEETVLTKDHYNNMQPSRVGDLTVWQGWIGNDWEILMMEHGAITMLTDNTVHDIGPRINGDYIIWQSEEPDGWKVRVYNRLTKMTATISNAEGASIENPRFVLLYDAKHENGDVETRGYDLESGKEVPLAALPGSVPDTIPDPDQTGEKRALLAQNAALKAKTEDEGDDDLDTPSPGDTLIPPENATSTDLVIPPLVFSPEMDNASSSPIITIPDLVISTSSVEVISDPDPALDLVIPAFDPATTTDMSDPQ